jgi:hypothetical protein
MFNHGKMFDSSHLSLDIEGAELQDLLDYHFNGPFAFRTVNYLSLDIDVAEL